MLEVTVKTLDSQNHSFSVNDEITVKEFKDEIAPVLNITADKQRLIFCGKVLKDDKKLSEYDVNGKVIHVVQSLPPSQGNNSSSNGPSANSTSNGGSRNRDAAGFLLGAFTIPQDLVDPAQVQNIVQDVVSGMGEIGRNATVMSRASDDGSVDVHINLGRVPVSVPMQSEAQIRMNRVRNMLSRADILLVSLEDGANASPEAVADSSSQTETENDEAHSSTNDTESINSSTPNEIPNNSGTSTSEESTPNETTEINAQITSEINLPESSIGSGGFRFEGLAHAAQAAISAAFATAAAAARVAATTDTPPTSTTGTTPPSDSEPMDTTTENEIRDFLSSINIHPDPSVIAMDTLPSDSEPVTQEQAQRETETNSAHHPDCPLSSSRTSPANESTSPSRPTPTQQPSVQTVANLLDEVIRINTRLQPCLERCRDLIRSDPTLTGRLLSDAHRLFSRVSQLLHFLSHAYHSLSDLHINFSQPPPRSPRVRIISSTQNPALFQGLPMQAQINITSTSGFSPNTNQSTTTTTTTANNTNSSDASRNSTENNGARPVPAPRVNQPSSSSPLLVQRTHNPFVFMEVSPTSVTIDRITSMITTTPVSSSSNVPPTTSDAAQQSGVQTTTTTTTTNASTTPRDAPTPSQSDETPTSNNQNSSPQRSTPNATSGQEPPQINIPIRNLIPVPLSSMGSVHAFDSALPCHSVWALEPSRRRHNAGNARNPANSSNTVTPNAPGQPEDQVQNVISNIMMSLLNHGPTAGGPIPSLSVFSSRANNSRSNSRSQPNQNNSRGERIATMQRRFQIYEPMTYDETVDMFYGLEAYNMKIAEFFPDVDFEAKGTFGKILKFFAEELTIKDIIHIAYGKYECLNKLRVPIQRFFEDNILCDGSDDDAIENIIGKITHEILEEIKPFTNSVKLLHEEVNFVGELFIFIENGIRDLLPILLNKSVPADVSYGDHLIAALQEISREFLIVNEKCSHNANMVLERMLRDHCELVIRASRVNRPSHDALCTWILTTVRTFMRTFMPNLTSDGQIAASNNTSASKKKSNEAKPNSSESTRPRTNTRYCAMRRRNFVEALGVNEALASGLSANRPAPTFATFARIAEQTSALLRNNTRSSDNHRNIAEVVLGSDSWHNSVPRDWVPIIARDVQRQRRQATQAPLSNAYLSGMPSKRRKIMTNGNPTLLEPSNSALSEMLLQAMSSANVKPIENIDELKKDILENSALQTSFNKHMKNVIQDRLQCDLDYCSERFPNSEKYFK
ncbi:hypothetical protein CDAR_451442 [Caerostris darwini]|uniref:BCL2-associated athanogene 6 n=1 Tax=Caerostris darwini TaxID=1538125 RepID=A0AAV4SG07_9ARAC|nr:hypothetical protein CDAR_451442 [Caerostris darwini]